MIIKMKNVSKAIKNEVVLNDINLELKGGNIYGIYGRNGSGKTMLLRCLSGVIEIDSGTIICDKKILHRDMDILPNLGLMIENSSFWKMYSGFQNLKMLASIRGGTDDKSIYNIMEELGLDAKSPKPVRKYSLGMRQKLAICQAVMERPDIILLDEPTNALDESSITIFREILLREKERGAIVVIASHNMDDIAILSDKKLHMVNGSMEEID